MTPDPRPPAPPSDIPAAAFPFIKEMGYLNPDRLKVGDTAPAITLEQLAGGAPVTIGAAGRPTVLIFGSYT
ncbi:MAG TPA: hypothetical protein VFJ58_28355 [Armatimonadota bacterium]|nr:hypothetical protein [Armatimonadota bacterium]